MYKKIHFDQFFKGESQFLKLQLLLLSPQCLEIKKSNQLWHPLKFKNILPLNWSYPSILIHWGAISKNCSFFNFFGKMMLALREWPICCTLLGDQLCQSNSFVWWILFFPHSIFCLDNWFISHQCLVQYHSKFVSRLQYVAA